MNPIRDVREKQHKTQEEFARDCGVHPQALFLNEQGVYPHVLPSVMDCIKKLGYDEDEIQRNYRSWQEDVRITNGIRYLIHTQELGPPTPSPPVESFRMSLGLSRMAFAKKFGLHPAELSELESGRKHTLSEQFKTAMAEAGMKATVLGELEFRCQEYAELVKHRSSIEHRSKLTA